MVVAGRALEGGVGQEQGGWCLTGQGAGWDVAWAGCAAGLVVLVCLVMTQGSVLHGRVDHAW